jgi:hypothetical protein
MAPKKKQIEGALRELALAHTQLVQIRKNHLDKNDGSEIVLGMLDQGISKLEVEITVTTKALFNSGAALKSSSTAEKLAAKL